jgi:DNA-binding MarR family transcriptional regulator
VSTRKRKTTKRREELLGKVLLLGRDLGAYTVMMHTAIAHAVGLNATDHKSLDLLGRHGPMTAGALSELTGLTTGAVTGVIDRLEKAGFVERRPDPDDRRRVIVAARPDAADAYGNIFDSLGASTLALAESYTDEALEAITDWVTRTIELIKVETAKIRDRTPS